jgi:branched-chain amino acid transport system permease protein
MRLQATGLALLLAAAIAFPLVFPNPFVTNIMCYTVIYVAAATSWNIFSGYTGYTSLGHAAFFGTGGYALALMCLYWHVPGGYLPFALLPLCGLVAAILAIPVGAVALRVRSHAFVVITIAIFFIFQLMAANLRPITGGRDGLPLPFAPWNGYVFNLPFIYVGLVIVVLAYLASWFVRNSKYGLGLLAIRDDEDRARGLGVRTSTSKLTAFVISAFFVGMAGALLAYFNEDIRPEFAFNALDSVSFALMTILGGAGTLGGPLLGALILEPVRLYSPSLGALIPGQPGGIDIIIYGVLFLVVVLLLPEGIIPTVRKRWIAWRSRRPTVPAAPSATALAAGSTAGAGQTAAGSQGAQP